VEKIRRINMVKKISDGTSKEKIDIGERIRQNTWNPFERVDPKILEMLHRKHEKARKYYLLTKTEDAPV
jgi:hypothetical protein